MILPVRDLTGGEDYFTGTPHLYNHIHSNNYWEPLHVWGPEAKSSEESNAISA